MKHIATWIVFLLLAVVPTKGRSSAGGPVAMTLHPASVENTDKYRFVPAPTEQKDEDAVPVYAKAVQLLPKDYPADQINKWRAMPLDKLPIEQVSEALQALRPSLQMVEQAAKCRQCNWPAADVTTASLSEYRRLAFALALQASLQTAQGQYGQAVNTIGAGFAMARHVGEGPNLVQGLVGVAIGAVMCQQVEKTIQGRGAPNLYWALRGLPKPVVDLSRPIGIEKANLQQYKDPAIRKKMEDGVNPALENCQLLVNRLDRHVAVLQCIEAIRHFAATHGGKFPNELAAITAVALPQDPVTGPSGRRAGFVYKLTDAVATLEGPTAKGGNEKDMIRYELKLNPPNVWRVNQ